LAASEIGIFLSGPLIPKFSSLTDGCHWLPARPRTLSSQVRCPSRGTYILSGTHGEW
jgi:hypothetical protein